MYILASASPRRQELLRYILKDFKTVPSSIEENVPDSVALSNRPEYLARAKARDVAGAYPEDTVIGADTSVIADGRIFGKPSDAGEAREMLAFLSGRTHTVITGCAVCKNGLCRSFSSRTSVGFYRLSAAEIEEYISTGEPFDKAGAYGIQGRGALLVKRISGDYFNVVGLPVAKLARFLKN